MVPLQLFTQEIGSLQVQILSNKKEIDEYKKRLNLHTPFTDAALQTLRKAFQAPVKADSENLDSVDIISTEDVKTLFQNSPNNYVVMINDRKGASVEASAFHHWVAAKGKSLITHFPYLDTDPLDISFFFKDTSDKKILHAKASGITVGEFMSNYVPIIKDNFILKIFHLFSSHIPK